MLTRQPRLQRILLSPGVSLIMGAVGALLMFGHWGALVVSIVMAAAMTSQIKVLTLFRGRNYPFVGLFMLLQAALTPDAVGTIMGITALAALILLLHSSLEPDNTRTFFFIYLLCGIGALFCRSFAFLAALLTVGMVLVRAFSARGLMAAFLGFITPAILFLPFGLEQHMSKLQEVYLHWLAPGYSVPLLVVTVIAFVGGCTTFLPSYGYPAQARARNMTILGLTIGAIVLPFVDGSHAAQYFAMLNLCAAYILTHLAAIRRAGWIWVVLTWIGAIAVAIAY